MTNLENISTKSEIRQALQTQDAEITFTKSDGSTRIMKCTLRPDVIVQYEKKTERTREPLDHILPVWDLEADAWRSINVDKITDVKLNVVHA